MKVLLVGEYSGFFNNLKAGLLSLGVDCQLASGEDGFKKIGGMDIQLFGRKNGSSIFSKIYNYIIYPFVHKKSLYGFDVVLMIGPSPFYKTINKCMFKKIKKHCKKIYVSVCGGTFSLYKSWENKTLSYYVFDDNPYSTGAFNYHLKKNFRRYATENYVYDNADGIIPIMYEYAVGVKERKNCRHTIPLPFDSSTVCYKPNIVLGKIRIAHGIIREHSKGTKVILKALDIIKRKYPNEVEIVIPQKMPLKEYIQFLSTINVLVDQCKEHCYGLNALYAMASGRIVLGGASDNSLKEFGLTKCPVFHIEYNVESIVKQIENVISLKSEFERIGKESRTFVETFHNHTSIAAQYLSLWEKDLKQ